jgi:hypothetical protein
MDLAGMAMAMGMDTAMAMVMATAEDMEAAIILKKEKAFLPR